MNRTTDSTVSTTTNKTRPRRVAAALVTSTLVLALAFTGLAGCGSRDASSTGTGSTAGASAGSGATTGSSAGAGSDTGTNIGTATLDGDIQRVTVDASGGTFVPDVITVAAGIPIEIAFSQAPGGCLSGVIFPDFDIAEDLTAGPRTITLPALEPGEYAFYCQMGMISAKMVAE